MEMHQVRYFLALARTRNFTQAASECNVSQPSLTRAIQQLEAEFGGDLFRRERPQALLTELGQRMMPFLQQCDDSARAARALASSMKKGEAGTLRIALSDSIDGGLLVPHVKELGRHFHGLDLKLLRGSAADVARILKEGRAELGLIAAEDTSWDRFDRWPLFSEPFRLLLSAENRLANQDVVDAEELRQERLLTRAYCEQADKIAELLRKADIDVDRAHELNSDRDLVQFLEADLGIAVAPASAVTGPAVTRAALAGFELERTVYLYGVAGRERSPAATAAMKMLRACNWKRMLA
ncbi:LysR family transcriptional regulator [Rhodoplanes roseus]|uniref:Transcriptional regulator n=1 Tax=Rhodoplanes roseus TaxID=29409 RepID=A0A327L590_9BRAD|nr:LysR family transcriptional regulator [Rhodoplanes roseus]RAI42788.1 transcriptional regulator [Rhodoplanes roseus]